VERDNVKFFICVSAAALFALLINDLALVFFAFVMLG
jgi:hypothetical protein